eukprot:XP_766390.1 hypothetical protein [Theileria parva strain Muguga]
MSLSYPELEQRILEIKKKICKPNCKKCKRALHESIEIKSKIFNSSKKRHLGSGDESNKYYDAIEYTSDSLPCSGSEEPKSPVRISEPLFTIPTTSETVKPLEQTLTHQPVDTADALTHKIPEPIQKDIEKPQDKVVEPSLTIEQDDKPRVLFTSESKTSVDDKSPFDILHKINAPIPKGNPLFAPTQQDSNLFKPKTDGANFVFGQSQPSVKKPPEPANIFANQQQQMQQNQLMNPQLVIPGFGQNILPQNNGSNPFTTGQFFRSRRGRGRGRGR